MVKFYNAVVTFSEIPEEVTLCIELTNCKIHCDGCHSPHLWEDVGEVLTNEVLKSLIEQNDGITCVCFMGGDSNKEDVESLLWWIKDNTKLKTGWYRGIDDLNSPTLFQFIDYYKIGSYKKELGGLDKKTTNQRMYKVTVDNSYNKKTLYKFKDITYKFWKHEIKNKN